MNAGLMNIWVVIRTPGGTFRAAPSDWRTYYRPDGCSPVREEETSLDEASRMAEGMNLVARVMEP